MLSLYPDVRKGSEKPEAEPSSDAGEGTVPVSPPGTEASSNFSGLL